MRIGEINDYNKIYYTTFKICLYIVIYGLLFSRCVDPIPFEAIDKEPKLVIFGTFTQLPQEHEVRVSMTDKFGKLGIPVSGANVKLMDEDGITAEYFESEEGEYILPEGALCGESGKAYKLKVVLPDERQFESAWEVMPDLVQMDKPKYEVNKKPTVSSHYVIVNQFFIDIIISTPIVDNRYFRWEVDEVYSVVDLQSNICFIDANSQFGDIKIFSCFDNSQIKHDDYVVFSRQVVPYYQFSAWHYFNVSQYSISESTYDYWSKIDIVTTQTGTIFDKIPAAVTGNISEIEKGINVLGYFEVAAVTSGRVKTTYEELIERIHFPRACNGYLTARNQPAFCISCSVLSNQITRPDYWGE